VFERVEESDERDDAREQKQRVHAPVDPVEDEHPRGGGEDRSDDAYEPVGEPRAEHGDRRNAGDGEHERHDPQLRQAAAEMRDRPREHEVQRRPTALCDHRVEDVRQGPAPDEECERLVLVRRPRAEVGAENGGERARGRPNGNPEPADWKVTRARVCERDSACRNVGHRKGDSGGYPLRRRW